MLTLTDHLGNNEADWMTHPERPCAQPINDPALIRARADSWYPREKYYDQAKTLCDGCPVMTQCLAYALNNGEDEGIWGGTTPKERASILRRRNNTPAQDGAA